MTEGEPQPGKSREQLEVEIDKIDRLLSGLSNFLHSDDKVDQEQLEILENSWGDIAEQANLGKIGAEQGIEGLNRVFGEMRNLAFTSGITPEEITPEKLDK